MGGDPWSEKTRKVLKDEIVTHDLTEEAGIDYINVLLVGEVGNIFFFFFIILMRKLPLKSKSGSPSV